MSNLNQILFYIDLFLLSWILGRYVIPSYIENEKNE